MNKKSMVLDRSYVATLDEVWELWTTKEGFESWWGPDGFRVEVSAIDARVGGELAYEMIAATEEMIAAMKQMGQPPSHGTRGTFSVVEPKTRLAITHVIDFLPGVTPFENTMHVDLRADGAVVHMKVTLEAMPDESFTRMQGQGFTSQLTKLDKRFPRPDRPARIFTHLWYAKDAEAAATLYASIFPDSRVDSVRQLMSESPSGPAGSVAIVDFTLFGQRFQAITAGPHHEFNDAMSLVVECDDQEELDRYWNALLDGGGKEQACGWLIDRYGVRWQIVPRALNALMHQADPERSKRVTDCMLKMVKLDIAKLEAAYRS